MKNLVIQTRRIAEYRLFNNFLPHKSALFAGYRRIYVANRIHRDRSSARLILERDSATDFLDRRIKTLQSFENVHIILILKPFFRKPIRYADGYQAILVIHQRSILEPSNKIRFRQRKLYLA